MTMEDTPEVTHRCPIGDDGWTPCCDRTPFELPLTDRMTVHTALVTCKGRAAQRQREAEARSR